MSDLPNALDYKANMAFPYILYAFWIVDVGTLLQTLSEVSRIHNALVATWAMSMRMARPLFAILGFGMILDWDVHSFFGGAGRWHKGLNKWRIVLVMYFKASNISICLENHWIAGFQSTLPRFVPTFLWVECLDCIYIYDIWYFRSPSMGTTPLSKRQSCDRMRQDRISWKLNQPWGCG